MKRTHGALAGGLVVIGMLLAGCTSTPSPVPKPTTTQGAGLTAKQVAKKIKDTVLPANSLASTTGTISAPGISTQVRIDVEEVRALADSTMLVWRLSTASGEQEDVTSFQFAVKPFLDTRNVALMLDGGAKTLRPFTFQYENDSEAAMSCLCGKPAHASDGTGLQLFALMPPLPKGTRAVDVSMPGFDVMKDVPVSR
jgi:hypothetical protein